MSDVLILNADLSPVNLIPLSTMSWQEAIKAVFLETVSVVEEYDDWEVHSPSLTMRVPSVVMTKRFLYFQRKVSFTKENLKLRDRYVCQYCMRGFAPNRLTMDHVLPRKYGGRTTWDNITSACAPCNLKKAHNKKIVPKRMPKKPTYYDLLDIAKEYPITVPCEKWVKYLDWPVDNLFITDKKILRTRLAA